MTAASTTREERVSVLDATFAEEQLRSGSFTGTTSLGVPDIVALNKSGEVCWLNKSGGLSMEAGEVLECVRIAYERVCRQGRVANAGARMDQIY